jgi:hypothetical protein
MGRDRAKGMEGDMAYGQKKEARTAAPNLCGAQGKTYQANYYVESGVVIVEAMSKHGTIARNQAIGGGSMAEHYARTLLIAMIDAGRVPES